MFILLISVYSWSREWYDAPLFKYAKLIPTTCQKRMSVYTVHSIMLISELLTLTEQYLGQPKKKIYVELNEILADNAWTKAKVRDNFYLYVRTWVRVNHRVHRVAMTTFWRTFHHIGKISPGWWGWGGSRPPPFTLSTITYKVVVYALVERADTPPLFLLDPCVYSMELTIRNEKVANRISFFCYFEPKVVWGKKKCSQREARTVNFDMGKKKYILLNKNQCTLTWNFKFVIT